MQSHNDLLIPKELKEVDKAAKLAIEKADTSKARAEEAYTKAEQAFQAGSETKQKLVDKLTSVEIEASTDESFDNLIGKIMPAGSRWASGTMPISERSIGFYGSLDKVMHTIDIANLGFVPKAIIIHTIDNSNSKVSISVYEYAVNNTENLTVAYESIEQYRDVILIRMADPRNRENIFRPDGTYRMPVVSLVNYRPMTSHWIAYE